MGGDVFSWGLGEYGRLGHGNETDQFSPTKISVLPAEKYNWVTHKDRKVEAQTQKKETETSTPTPANVVDTSQKNDWVQSLQKAITQSDKKSKDEALKQIPKTADAQTIVTFLLDVIEKQKEDFNAQLTAIKQQIATLLKDHQ